MASSASARRSALAERFRFEQLEIARVGVGFTHRAIRRALGPAMQQRTGTGAAKQGAANRQVDDTAQQRFEQVGLARYRLGPLQLER